MTSTYRTVQGQIGARTSPGRFVGEMRPPS